MANTWFPQWLRQRQARMGSQRFWPGLIHPLPASPLPGGGAKTVKLYPLVLYLSHIVEHKRCMTFTLSVS